MNKELFKEGLESPAVEYLFKYLKDSAIEESEILSETIINGGYIPKEEQIQKSTICATLNSIADIEFEEIESFYKERDE